MFTSTNFQISKRHLLAKKKQSLIAILGVTFGIAMYVLMASVMNGVNKFLDDTQFDSTPHIRLYNEIKTDRESVLAQMPEYKNSIINIRHQKPKNEKLNLKDGFQALDYIKNDLDIFSVSAQLSTPVFYNYGSAQITGNILGVDIEAEDRLFKISKKIKSGHMESIISVSNGILMGAGLAKKLNVHQGDNVTVTTPKGVVIILKIVGIFKIGIGAIDNVRCYAKISTVQKILQKDHSYITDISLKVRDVTKAKAKALEYGGKFDYKIEDWETANSTMITGMKVRNMMTYIVSLTLLIVAGFGIYNIMSMSINDKMKDIAILKATGFAGKDIVQIFMMQAMIIGFLGACVGIIIGFTLSYGVSLIPFDGGDFFSLDHFPVDFNPKFYVIGVLFGVITTAIAGYMPSRKASQIDPVAILRG
jgi:lipoprotein-releasing system permease protein